MAVVMQLHIADNNYGIKSMVYVYVHTSVIHVTTIVNIYGYVRT